MRPAGILRLGVAVTAAAVLTACSGPVPSHPAQVRAPEPTYYLARAAERGRRQRQDR